jgi:hypothetical protein
MLVILRSLATGNLLFGSQNEAHFPLETARLMILT